jgi:hypothetical protein
MRTALHDSKQVSALSRLLCQGFVADPERHLQPILQGIAHLVPTGWVVSRVMLAQLEVLSSDNEMVMALLALQPELRQPWLSTLAARCKEAGQMKGDALLDLISQLRGAAVWVEEQFPHALLSPTATGALERELLGVSAEQAAATPMLTRILAAGFALYCAQALELPALPAVDLSGVAVAQNWLPGRLLALPGSEADHDYLLAGPGGENVPDGGVMSWALANPWATLLTMVVYAQDTWDAEARGGLLLELSSGQSAYQPAEVTVLVMGPEGDETRCGTLAQLLLRVVAHMAMHFFPHHPRNAELNASLTPLIGQLLERRVWRYSDGVSGSNGQYRINPEFADACYRMPGSKVFNRTGKHLWQAVRIQAEQWRKELQPAVAKGVF